MKQVLGWKGYGRSRYTKSHMSSGKGVLGGREGLTEKGWWSCVLSACSATNRQKGAMRPRISPGSSTGKVLN